MPRLPAVIVSVVAATVIALPAPVASGKKAKSKTATVYVKDDVFSPKSRTIKKGTLVAFRWRGKSVHDVIAKRGSKTVFRISLRSKGTVRKRFTKKGTYKLICSIHTPNMKATIRVR